MVGEAPAEARLLPRRTDNGAGEPTDCRRGNVWRVGESAAFSLVQGLKRFDAEQPASRQQQE